MTLELLDAVANAVANQRMEGEIGVAPIVAQRIRAGMPGGADLLVFATWALASGPGFHAGLVDVAPERFRMRTTANRAVSGRARLQPARRFGKIEGLIAEFAAARQQFQYNQERNKRQRPINRPRPRHPHRPPAIEMELEDKRILP